MVLAAAEVDEREPARRSFRHEVEQQDEPGRIAPEGRVVRREPPDQPVAAEQAEVHGDEVIAGAQGTERAR